MHVQKWAVVDNDPGYLPDNPAEAYDTYDSALIHFEWELRSYVSYLEEGGESSVGHSREEVDSFMTEMSARETGDETPQTVYLGAGPTYRVFELSPVTYQRLFVLAWMPNDEVAGVIDSSQYDFDWWPTADEATARTTDLVNYVKDGTVTTIFTTFDVADQDVEQNAHSISSEIRDMLCNSFSEHFTS